MKAIAVAALAAALTGCASHPMSPYQAAMISQGFQQAGAQIAAGSTYQPQPVYVPPMPQLQLQPAQPFRQIDTPTYQLINGATAGNIHYF